MVSILPLIFRYPNLFSRLLETVPRVPFTIGISITFMFHSFFSSLARFSYLSIFPLSLMFPEWFTVMAKSTIESYDQLCLEGPWQRERNRRDNCWIKDIIKVLKYFVLLVSLLLSFKRNKVYFFIFFSSLFSDSEFFCNGNLLSFLLRYGTRPYERGTQWDSNSCRFASRAC